MYLPTPEMIRTAFIARIRSRIMDSQLWGNHVFFFSFFACICSTYT